MCEICDNDYEGLTELEIVNCSKVVQIPNIQCLTTLIIHSGENLTQIPNIQGLHILRIFNCPKLAQIPTIQGLNELHIVNCPKVAQIPNIKGLNNLYIGICKYFKYIYINDKLEISRYLTRYKLHSWLKRMLFLRSARYKALWRIAEYYTRMKYSPANALKYLNLDD